MSLRYNNNAVKNIILNGKNLQPIKNWSERTINGVTCSITDGVGYLNGTSTAGSWQQTELNAITLSAGTYTIYFWTNFVQGTGQQQITKFGLGLRNSSHETWYKCNLQKYTTFTLTQQETFNIVFWWEGANMIFSNTYIKSMVKQGTFDATTTFDPFAPNTIVKKLIKDNTLMWLKPYTFTLNKTGSPVYSANITATSEPSASTRSVVNGDDVYYTETLKVQYQDGIESSTSSTTSPSSVTAPVVASKFTGSLGANITNNNSFSVTAYYYINRAGTRVPSSGYNSKTIAANTTITLTGLASSSYANQTTIYVYFSASATLTSTTTATTYSGSVSGLTSTSTSTTTFGNLETITVTGSVDGDVTFTVSKSTTTNTSTSATTKNSTTSSTTLNYA